MAASGSTIEITGSNDLRYKNRVGYFAAVGDAGTGDAATVVLYLVQRDGLSGVGRILGKHTATITPTTRRDNLANSAANGYLATVSFDISSNNAADLSAALVANRGFEWRAACTDLGGLTSLEFHVIGFDSEV